MKEIDVTNIHYKEVNRLVREDKSKKLSLTGVMGQRFIGCALENKELEITGVPGNALGSCLNEGSKITVHNNCQDATGDTMNDGEIIIHGNCGDTAGYAMRGGKIFIKESAGYRMGLHMKAYKNRQPLMIIGDSAGSFLGEYLAGGTIIVLGLKQNGKCPVGNFCGTGMYGGRIFLRSDSIPCDLSKQVEAKVATREELNSIFSEVEDFCNIFNVGNMDIMNDCFYILTASKETSYGKKYIAV